MRRSQGFTLLEILIVVVIAASVLVFALPAHKRAQDRNMYLAAQGVLFDLANAVQTLRMNLAELDPEAAFPAGTAPVQVLAAWQNASTSDYTTAASNELNVLSDTQRRYALFARNYLQPIPYDSGNVYKAYTFYICPPAGSNSQCCGNDTNVVACMQDTDAATTRAAAGLYYGALVLQDGSVVQISQ